MLKTDNTINYLIKEVIKYTAKQSEQKTLRVSSLPYCPLRMLQDKVINKKEKISYQKGFFTSIGHAVHENVQHYMGRALPELLIGDWKCSRILSEKEKDGVKITRTCSNIQKMSCRADLKIKCKHGYSDCLEHFKYEELTFEYNGLSGHLDCLLKIKNKYWVLDFKTTGDFLFENPSKATKLGYYPNPKYLVQIETYCVLLKLIYNIDVYAFGLVYMSRDRHDKKKDKDSHYEFMYKMNKTIFNKRKAEIKKAIRGNRLVAKALIDAKNKKIHVKKIYEERLCEDKLYYLNEVAPTLFSGDEDSSCPNHNDKTCYNGKVIKKIVMQWNKSKSV